MTSRDLLRDFMDAAEAFFRREMWRRFTNFDCVGLRVPGQEELLVACVLGDAGEEYGLNLFRGPRAADDFHAMTTATTPDEGVVERIDLLGFTRERFGHLPPELQADLRAAGLHPRFDKEVPHLISKPTNHFPRTPDEAELRLLLIATRALVRADRQNLLIPAPPDDERGVCVITVEDETAVNPTVDVTREPLPRSATLSGPGVFAASGVDLTGHERGEGSWLVATMSTPATIINDPRSMRALMVVDEADGRMLDMMPFFADELSAAVDRLVDVFDTHGLPGRVVFADRQLHDALAPALDKAGVSCDYEAGHPLVEKIAEHFYKSLEKDGPDPFADEADEDVMPAPDDLAGWKKAGERLAKRFADHLWHGERPASTRAVKRYFGDDDLAYYLKEHEQRGVLPAYAAWCMLDYRPTKKSATQAEKLLEEGLPEAQAVLLRAMMAGHPTIYRLAAADPEAGTIDLEDVLLGGQVRVHDQLLSENSDPGIFLSARTYPAGQFHFVELAGPPLGFGMGHDAVEYLRECGLRFEPEALKREAHKFGWLWAWVEQWQADWQPPHLTNTDGEDLLPHTAFFSVEDPEAVRRALHEREDIDYDEAADEFVWVAVGGTGRRSPGGPVTLAELELIDDELIVTVNSAERFARAREWVERLPGVKFGDVQVRELDPFADDDEGTPPDELMEPETPPLEPEDIAAIQAHFDQQYMSWLDAPLPILDGLTPREAVRTPEGREQVETLIRTMPDPIGPARIEPPRRRLLRELGLPETRGGSAPEPTIETESIDDWAALEPVEPIRSGPRVGRNDPCPCGSGRKYKKCCGQ